MEILHHDFVKKKKTRKVFTSTWCQEILGFESRFSEILRFFFTRRSTPGNSVMQLEFIVIVTIINLLRRLKTSNENHKFSSAKNLLPSDFRLNRNDLFSFDHQSEFFTARYFCFFRFSLRRRSIEK